MGSLAQATCPAKRSNLFAGSAARKRLRSPGSPRRTGIDSEISGINGGNSHTRVLNEVFMKSTKLLMADHELILQALHVLDAMNTEMRNGRDVNRDDIRSLVTFLREFADGCHHVKEEVIFFPALIQAGIAFQVRVMTYEHEGGRALTNA